MTDAIASCNEMRAALMRAYRALPYADYLRTDHWRAIRLVAIERSGGRCQLCGGGEKLHVHHVTYKNLGDERPEDLTVVCQKCHAKFHDKSEAPLVQVTPEPALNVRRRRRPDEIGSAPIPMANAREANTPSPTTEGSAPVETAKVVEVASQSDGIIEVAWKKGIVQYRQRPAFPCYIEFREKGFGATWQRLSVHATPEAAAAALWEFAAPKEAQP